LEVAGVHGAGHVGVREGAWEADRTIELKLICVAAVADAVAARVMTRDAPNCRLTPAYSWVWVLRSCRPRAGRKRKTRHQAGFVLIVVGAQ
jgi:hypothetical protein